MRSVIANHGPGSNPRAGGRRHHACIVRHTAAHWLATSAAIQCHARQQDGASPPHRLRKAGRHWPAAILFLVAQPARPARWVFSQLPCWRLGAWLRPVSRGNRHFTVGGGRLRQSGPRPEGKLLRQPALEGLTRSARTDSPRKVGRNKFRRGAAAAAMQGGGRQREVGGESTGCVLGKRVYLVILAMSLFDLQDVCIVIGSLATLDLPMVVDLIGIYVLKGPYSSTPCAVPSLLYLTTAAAPPRAAAPRRRRDRTCFDRLLEKFPSVPNSKPMSYAEVVDSAVDVEEGLRNRRSRARPQAAQGGRPLFREHSLLSLPSLLINPRSSSRSSSLSSLAVKGSDLVAISLRRSLVLVRLVLADLVAVVLGQSFVASVEARIRLLSVLVCRALVISVVSMGISRGCVRRLDSSKPQPHLRVEEDRLGSFPSVPVA
ncbi:hypothetical protein F511_17271 [Dorcoceras hygrometricum]|uniref:Uncharacterized protein n=1 Tax=Dorcoceras hygrometricum TaxID=472368 RepID=A0A2Z7BR18_9LAMI|nr:hypothetical protein F511_17271 [Dorcoceras hygrometricum]